MKQFFQNFFASKETKGVFVFATLFALVWSVAWTEQDQMLDLKPLYYALGFLTFYTLMCFIFRNNK